MKTPILFILLYILLSSASASEYYSLDDFNKVDKIDSHVHVQAKRDAFVEQARRDNFRLLNIVVDTSRGSENIEKKHNDYLSQKTSHPEEFEFATTFSIKEWDDPNWVNNTIDWLDKGIKQGAIAVKVWKNIGMTFRDKSENLVMIDNPKFDSIFSMLSRREIPVIGHLGEPKNCWLPIAEMTTNNDKRYFRDHPEYHMYQHPELPTYEEQIAARDRMLERNPDLIFIGAHMGSLEWSVDELERRLDKFPNLSVDMAARIGQLFHQTKEDREKVRQFFIKYQDRLLYATDMADRGNEDVVDLQSKMHKTWVRDWQYFATDNVMTSELVTGEFRGLHLPRGVIDNIYSRNAIKWLKMFSDGEK